MSLSSLGKDIKQELVKQQKKKLVELKKQISLKEQEGNTPTPQAKKGKPPVARVGSLVRRKYEGMRRDQLFAECLNVKDQMAEL